MICKDELSLTERVEVIKTSENCRFTLEVLRQAQDDAERKIDDTPNQIYFDDKLF